MRSKNLRHAPWLIVLGLVLGGLSPAWGQGTEAEPNNTCATAQAFGAISPPFTVTGNLENVPPNGDVDFLRFFVVPNSVVVADLEGLATNRGTLRDPALGLYDSSCRRVAVNNSGGDGTNSRLGFVVPADGVVIMAVGSCCDSTFTRSAESGTYRLTLSPGGFIAGSIADQAGHAINNAGVATFTPAGRLVGFPRLTCCAGDKSTFEQIVAAGTYRVVAYGQNTRSWHHNRPSFAQADNVTVAPGQRVTGLDFTLTQPVQIQPSANQSSFVAGDTLRVDLTLRNPSATATSVIVNAAAFVPAEPGIGFPGFFGDTIAVVPATTITLPAGNDTVIHDFATYHFTGAEQTGFYSFCVVTLQGAVPSSGCDFFTFGSESNAGPAGDAAIRKPNPHKRP